MGVDPILYAKLESPMSQERLMELTYLAYCCFPQALYLDVRNDGRKCYGMGLSDDRLTLSVGLNSRYYGQGYERGDALAIIGIAEFIEFHEPKAEIHYGRDLDEDWDDLPIFGKAEREELRSHYFCHAHIPYRKSSYETGEPPLDSVFGKPMYLNGKGPGMARHFASNATDETRTLNGDGRWEYDERYAAWRK